MPKTIAERALDGIAMDLGNEFPRIVPRHPFLIAARSLILDGTMTSEHIGLVAERQSIFDGRAPKSVHSYSPFLRQIKYADAAVAIAIVEKT